MQSSFVPVRTDQPQLSRQRPTPGIIVIGNPGSRRVELFQAAQAGLGLPSALLISYQDLLTGDIALVDQVPPGSIVRIESPGKDFEVERLLLKLGAEQVDPEGEIYERLSRRELDSLQFEKGRILPSRQWYLGYARLLRDIEAQLAQLGTYQLMNHPADIQLMFDKRACHAFLKTRDVPVLPALEPVHSYDDLLAAMLKRGWQRVFIKPAHSSSASGVVAYRFLRDRHQAISTVEMVRDGGALRFYNSRRIRTYSDRHEIALLIDNLCRQRVHVEEWWPKASYAGKVFDLRVVVIAGQAHHTVARLSSSPMTNLHLLNERGDLDSVRASIGSERWKTALRTCERATRYFPSLYSGIDLLFTFGGRCHAIIEMNAFGDLLPGVLDAAHQDTYTAELRAAFHSRELCLTSVASSVPTISC